MEVARLKEGKNTGNKRQRPDVALANALRPKRGSKSMVKGEFSLSGARKELFLDVLKGQSFQNLILSGPSPELERIVTDLGMAMLLAVAQMQGQSTADDAVIRDAARQLLYALLDKLGELEAKQAGAIIL